ncbi:hypothetical protein [Hymenobacter sp. 5414T-23]|uniref:hypothetical protein n=1 Tax=Hymenobacter sp. 5414T-23 TaxID=2932252 RepID=UPI001FD2E8C5|nr:hypothetical protein [Hymenobacter sp. 5414T-23]UOQ82976.1 hypothetical protein MUN83_09540 [Hymenobacter sp. 5414T-23]
MARIKATERRRGIAPHSKAKTKLATTRGKSKVVVKRPSARPLPANMKREIASVIETARSFEGTPINLAVLPG